MQFEAKIMTNYSINELCTALAQLTLPESLGDAETDAMNEDKLTTQQRRLSKALLQLVMAHRRSRQLSHCTTEPDLDTTDDGPAAGMLILPLNFHEANRSSGCFVSCRSNYANPTRKQGPAMAGA